MRVMVMIKATEQSEAGEMPSEQLLTDMLAFNEELVKAGVMQAGEGLQPSSKGARVRFSGDKRTVIAGEVDPQRIDLEQAHRPPRSRPRSENPSPISPTPTPSSTSTRPGSVAIHHALSRLFWPSGPPGDVGAG